MAVVQVAKGDLNTWLNNQPANTVNTPYEIEITGLVASDFESPSDNNIIRTALRANSTKYVDLSHTLIPEGMTSLSYFLYECSTLVYAPVLPNGVEDLRFAFYNCTSLISSPAIPDSVTLMTGTFKQCSSLINAPILPNRITDLASTFDACWALVNAPDFPEDATSIITISGMFSRCISLKKAPVIPNYITIMNTMFVGCTSLENPPVIPEGVTYVEETFYGCTNLAYKPIIPSTVIRSTDCYKNVTQTRWGGSHSQVEDFISSQTGEFEVWEVEGTTPTGRVVCDIDITNLDTWLSTAIDNSDDYPFDIKVLNLDLTNYTDIQTALTNNTDKFVDLRRTTLPSGITSLMSFFTNCYGLCYSPDIPESVVNLYWTYSNCYYLKAVPNLLGSTPQIATISGAFENCGRLHSVDEHYLESMQSLTNISQAFKGTSITEAPIIPEGVTDISFAFENSNITVVPVVPSTVTKLTRAFADCVDLEVIEKFKVPLSVLDSSNAGYCFTGCSSLRQIGFKIDESPDWHVFSLKFFEENNNDYVSGTIYGVEQGEITTETIAQTQITKTNLQLPILTDELWFPSGATAQEIDSTIRSMLTNKYGVYNKEVIPPDGKYMVLWANNKDHFKTNIEMGGSGSGIKVYDTEDDIVEDLPNLKPLDIVAYKASKDPKSGVPLGTWASFENDSAPNGEWLQGGTTFDANTYPALAMMLGGNTVPERFDHSRLGEYEDITSIMTASSSTNKYTALYDGFITIEGRDRRGGVVAVNINGVEFWIDYDGQDASASTTTIPLKKGDQIYGSANPVDITNAQVRYYKHPLFIKATPTSSDSDYEGTLNSIREFYVRNNTYSIEERLTGGVWIDGKPIYRRTIHLQNISPTDDAKIVYTLEDYANISITKLDWLAKMTNNLVFSNFYNRRMEGGNVFFNVYYYQNNGQFRYICYDFTTADLYITIEYTKTT